MINGSDFPIIKKLIEKFGGKVNEGQLNSVIDAKVADGTIASGEQLDNNVQQTNIKIVDLDNKKANKTDLTNSMTPKGKISYSSLPTTGNKVGDYWYCSDGVNGAGNYAWNGTVWYFAGTGNEGFTFLKDDITAINSKIIDINYFDDCVKGGYTNMNGMFVENASYSDSKLVPCLSNNVFTIIHTIPLSLGNVNAILGVYNFFDSSKKWVMSKQLKDFSYVINTDTRTVTYTITIPLDSRIKYFSTYCMNDYWTNKTLTCTCNGLKNYKFNGKIPFSALYFDEKMKEEFIDKTTPTTQDGTQWRGKSWVAFGTSMTDTSFVNAESGEVTGKYVPQLVALSGLNVTNNGIAGGTLGRESINGARGNILDRILSTNVANADLITLEGFVNDFACAVPIGQLGDKENTTLYGSLYQAVNYLQKNSKAQIVLLTDSTGREYTFTGSVNTGVKVDYSYTIKKSNGLTQRDYNNAIINFAKFVGCYAIDVGAESQINCNNPQYLIDHLHHTVLGGKQYANVIWGYLKNIPLKALV